MTPEQILALPAGPELDLAVHQKIFGLAGKAKPYSTKAKAAMEIVDLLPLYVSRVAADHPAYDATKPYTAGTLAWNPQVNNDCTSLRIKSATWLVALCKAALLLHAAKAAPPKSAVYTGPRLGIPRRPVPQKMPPRPAMPKVTLTPKTVV